MIATMCPDKSIMCLQLISAPVGNEGTRYLGLYITVDRNTKPMEQHLWKKALTYTTAFRRTPMSRRKAGVLYRSCFIPAISYPLLATWLPDSFFAKVHTLSTSMILNKMGYHRNLPRCLVYAPRTFGGIGLCNLQTEMEVQQIMILIRHMQAKMPLGQAIEILIQQYQIWAGVLQHILQDTTPYSWVPDRWLSWLRQTMYAHNIQIRYPAWVIQPLRRNDVFLMEAINELGQTSQQLEQVNACRMYLQVTTLAEIVDHTGTTILPQAISLHPKNAPTGLKDLSSSTLNWPTIHPPSQASWKLWTKTICNLFSGAARQTKLCHPLGIWLPNYQDVHMWHWRLSPLGSLLHKANSTAGTHAALLIAS